MNIGIYGGTFNPPHLGHLAAAQAAIDTLNLDKLILVPAATPPHKSLPEGSPLQGNRLEMTQLMADFMRQPDVVEVSAMEMERQGESYTVDTLRTLRGQYPDAQLWLLMGTDMFYTLHQWRDPQEIFRLADVCAFGREVGDVEKFDDHRTFLEEKFGGRVATLAIPSLVEVSSTQLRDNLVLGGGGEFLPTTVYGYILRHGLYGTQLDLTQLDENKLRACSLSMVRAKRIAHIMGTEETAVQLAKHWGGDETDARRAGIIHDCTKYWSKEKHLAFCEQFKFPLDDLERNTEKLLHAKSGACMAKYIFGENDAVCNAIAYHTTARADMTLLEKILYMADYMEPNRDFDGVEQLRQLAFSDLDRGVLMGVDMTIADMEERNYRIHKNTREASLWLSGQSIAE